MTGLRPLLLAPFLALAAPAQEDSFRAELERLQRLAANGAYESTFAGLKLLLSAHEDRDYARRRRFEIETLHRRCAFRLRTRNPTPQDVVSGEILAHDPQTSTLRIRYSRDRLDDWRRDGELWTLDARFLGPHSLELRGGKYEPRGTPGEGARLVVLRGSAGQVRANAGLANVRGAVIVREHETQRTVLAEGERSTLESGKPFRIQLRVGDNFIRLLGNGSLLAETKKNAGDQGTVAFGMVHCDEVIVEGKVEPTWIQGRLDTLLHDQLRRFERHYDPHQELPAWLWVRRPQKGSDQERGEAWPDRLDEAQEQLVRDTERFAARNDFETGLRFLRGHPRYALPKATSAALQLGLLTSLEKYEEAALVAAELGELAPDAPLTRILRAELELSIGRGAESRRLLTPLLATMPLWERLHVDLALARMSDGELLFAKRGVDEALALGVDGPDLAMVNRTLVKAISGPDWLQRSTFVSSRFEVVANIDAATCKRVADLLEGTHTLLQRQLGAVAATGRSKVLLFAGPDGFHRYVEELWGSRICPNICGFYHPLTKQMLVCNDARESELLATVRHEGLHLFLDRLAPQAPVWLHEGLACYYERKVVAGTSFADGPADPARIAWLQTHALVPLAEFLARSPSAFYADSEQSYAQAWALATVLLDTKPEHKKRFLAYWKELMAGALPEVALRSAFPPEVLARLDRELAAFVLGIAAPK